MNYFKTALVDGNTIDLVNQQLHERTEERTPGKKLFDKTVPFGNGAEMIIEVTDAETFTDLSASLYDAEGLRIGRQAEIAGSIDREYEFEHGEDKYRVTLLRAARTTLDDKSYKQYLAEGGARCPFCGSESTDLGGVRHTSPTEIVVPNTCFECLAKVEEQYTLSEVIVLQGPSRHVAPPE